MSKEIYITNTECSMNNGRPEIHLYGRDKTHQMEHVVVEGFKPYFYVRPQAADEISAFDHEDIDHFEETDIVDLVDQAGLTKVVVSNPYNLHEVAQLFEDTWEADVDPENRFRIDHGVKTGVRVPSNRCDVSEVEPIEMDEPPRVMTFDIETDDRGEGFPEYGEARILSIVAHDSYSDEYVAFLDMEGESLGDKFPDADLNAVEHPEDLGLDHLDKLNFEPNEKRMLISFYSWVSDKDFDVIGGWNSEGFDTPFVIERASRAGTNAGRMGRNGGAGLTWRDDPYINGRSSFDFMDGWKDTKFTKVSGSLDSAAEMELDDAKIEHQDMGFYEMYEANTKKFLNYNTKDTKLTLEINEAANVLGFKTALRNTIGLDYEDTNSNKDFITMMVRRKLREKGYAGPTADPPDDAGSYDGAFVFEAFNGLKENVIGIDLASLYPNALWMLNASPETKVEPIEVEERDDGLYGLVDGEWIPVAKSSNDVYFRLDEDGIFRELVDEALELKAHAGEMMGDQSLTAEERADWAEEYAVRKTIVNSIYGVLGWVKFFLYDKDIASAITLTSQEVIKSTAEYVDEDTEANVAYGDTDSNYIEFDSSLNQVECLEAADRICSELNNEVYRDLCEKYGMSTDVEGIEWPTRFEIEIEMYASHFFQSGSKKFYAYKKTWEEGMDFSDEIKGGKGKLTIMGYPCKKANTAELTSQVQSDTLEAIVRGKSTDEIRGIIRDGAAAIDPSDPDLDLIGIPGGLGQGLEEYAWTDGSPQGASPRAAFFGNQFLDDVNFGEGDTVKRVYLNGVTREKNGETHQMDVIGYERAAQLDSFEGRLDVDVPRMQDTLIRNPMEDILEAIDVDVDAALKGQSQKSLAAF